MKEKFWSNLKKNYYFLIVLCEKKRKLNGLSLNETQHTSSQNNTYFPL